MSRSRTTLAFALAAAVLAGCFGFPRTLLGPNVPDELRPIELASDVAVYDLDNGAVLAVVPEKDTNLVAVDVRYLVGAADDPAGKEGLSHFVEHMLFTLRDGPDSPTLADRLSVVTLSYNAYTTSDITHYSSIALETHLPELLALEHERMSFDCAQIDEALLEREKDVVIQEMLQRGAGDADIMNALFYDGHVYANNIVGTASSIRSITTDDVCTFIETRYSTTNALVMVSGAVDTEAVRALVDASIGTIVPRAQMQRVPLRAMEPGTVDVELDFEHPAVLIAFPSPPYGSRSTTSLAIMRDVLMQTLYLSAGDNVRSVDVLPMTAARVPIVVYSISAEDDADLDELVELFFAARASAEAFVFDGLIERMVREHQTRLLERFESLRGRAQTVADTITYGGHRQFTAFELQQLEDLNAATVQALLAEHTREVARIVKIRPKSAADERPSFRALIDQVTRDHDVVAWHEPVDLADADRSLDPPSRPAVASPVELELDNGLRVVLTPDLGYPMVDVRLVIPAGYDAVPPDEVATPLLASYMITTPNLERYTFRDQVEARDALRMAGYLDADVQEDFTTFQVRGPSVDIEALLWRLYFEIAHGDYDADDVTKVKELIAELAKTDVSDAEVLERELFGDDKGFRTQLIESGAKVDVDALREFKREHFHLGGATLLITGDFDIDAVTAEVRRLFERVPAKPRAAASADESNESNESAQTRPAKDLAVDEPDAPQLRVALVYRLDEATGRNVGEIRISKRIVELRARSVRERLGATYGVDVSLDYRSGGWLLTVTTRVSVSAAAKAVPALVDALAELHGDTDVREDFIRARRREIERLLTTSSDSESIADELEAAVRHDVPWDFGDALVKRVAEITYDRVRPVLSNMLRPDTATRLLVGPKLSVEMVYESLGASNVRWLE